MRQPSAQSRVAAQRRGRAVADRAEDWRILGVLGPYRLLLVAALLTLYRTGYAPDFFAKLAAPTFYYGCLAYTVAALVLLLLGAYRVPGLRVQTHLHFTVDTLTIATLVLSTGGVGGGLGILLVPPVVGCSLVLSPRLTAVHAAIATLAMFAAEALWQLRTLSWDITNYTQAGLLGLMFFASGLVANTVAQRARRSEAVAERVGSEFVNLSRLSENIIESMQTGVLVVDADDRLRVANAAARRLVGRLAGGQPLVDSAPALQRALREWRNGRSDAGLPLAIDGREVIPRFTRLGWGDEAQVLVLLEDAALLRAQAQQIKLAALGRLSAGIAHEIRNPLSAITQASQLLAESPEVGGENQRLLAMIQRHAGRIERIIRDVLDLSRRGPSQESELPLREWLTRTAALYHESHAPGIRPIELADVPADFVVRFDPEHLQQVLFNLWDNSFEHGARSGRSVSVLLQAARAGGEAINLDVIDDGPGIPADLQERVFEPFFTTYSGGTGLGLFLCRELCEYNQAVLSYLPSRHGATFRIRFSVPKHARVPTTAPA